MGISAATSYGPISGLVHLSGNPTQELAETPPARLPS
jgi:hypothetical protein